MQQTLEKIGKQVFYKRLQQKMTQEELCQGICSVSYLSKIENRKWKDRSIRRDSTIALHKVRNCRDGFERCRRGCEGEAG